MWLRLLINYLLYYYLLLYYYYYNSKFLAVLMPLLLMHLLLVFLLTTFFYVTILMSFLDAQKNNKNHVAEKAIQELEKEFKRAFPEGGPVNTCELSVVTATLNSRFRSRGLSLREIMYQRDSFSGEQLNF